MTTDIFVGRIMSNPVEVCTSSTTAENASKQMRENDVGSLLVTKDGTQDSDLLGIITEQDIVTMVSHGVDIATANDVMTTDLVTINANDTIEKASNELFLNKINHLPVVDPSSGKAIGIISSTDIVHYITQSKQKNINHH